MGPIRGLLAVLAFAAAALAPAQYQTGTSVDPDVAFRSPKMKEIGVEQRLGQPIMGHAEFVDDTGKKVKLKEYFKGDRPVIFLPIFYRCDGVCFVELTGVIDTLKRLPQITPGKDVEIVAMSLKPTETYELARLKKQEFLKGFKPESSHKNWHFLTGDMENIRAVTDSLGFNFTYDKAKDEVSHPSGIMIITPGGTISSYMLGANFLPERLEKFIETAAKEEVGQKTQEIFFGCIHLDPVTGKRSLVIQNVLKVLAAATVIAITFALLVLTGKAKLKRA